LDNFRIDLLKQYWIDEDPNNETDLCSHGDVYLQIGDYVLSNEHSNGWTVASAALRLMKSAIEEYDGENDLQILPCCGYLRMFPSCPNYVTWSTKLEDHVVQISNLEASENKVNGHKIYNETFIIDLKQYQKQIVNFAKKVREFYIDSKPRIIDDEFDREQYELFWKEFNDYYAILSNKQSI
jgi:hypothetical protein